MQDDAQRRRAEKAERSAYHAETARRRSEQESAQAQALLDRFVDEAAEAGLPTETFRVRPWSGRGTYRTDVVGWYLRRDHSLGVGADGRFYVLSVAPRRFGRLRRAEVEPSPPPLEIGRGGRDGESIPLADLLAKRLTWESSDG